MYIYIYEVHTKKMSSSTFLLSDWPLSFFVNSYPQDIIDLRSPSILIFVEMIQVDCGNLLCQKGLPFNMFLRSWLVKVYAVPFNHINDHIIELNMSQIPTFILLKCQLYIIYYIIIYVYAGKLTFIKHINSPAEYFLVIKSFHILEVMKFSVLFCFGAFST